ncbi:unnamed protein product, partial [Meganyctiphanes norvegica]
MDPCVEYGNTIHGNPEPTSEGDNMGGRLPSHLIHKDYIKCLWVGSRVKMASANHGTSLEHDLIRIGVNSARAFLRHITHNPISLTNKDRKCQCGERATQILGSLWLTKPKDPAKDCKQKTTARFLIYSVVSRMDEFGHAQQFLRVNFVLARASQTPGGQNRRKEFLYTYLRQHVIWKSTRFWNAAFFDALQCERSMRPLVKRQDLENGQREETVRDEVHYQENITFGQLGTFTCNMHAFGLSKEMVVDFLRKQVTIASLRPDQVKLLKDNVERMYSIVKEWL